MVALAPELKAVHVAVLPVVNALVTDGIPQLKTGQNKSGTPCQLVTPHKKPTRAATVGHADVLFYSGPFKIQGPAKGGGCDVRHGGHFTGVPISAGT